MIRHKTFLILFSIILLLFTGCHYDENNQGRKNMYIIDVYYNPQELSVFGSEKLIFHNTEDVELKEIYFHLYPNSYREEDTAPMIGTVNDNFPNGFREGQIDMVKVLADGKIARWALEGHNKTLLHVFLNNSLSPGNRVEISLDFQEKLPYGRTDFGCFENVACFENWYPILCVFDKYGWHKEPVCRIGESNFSEAADYTVDINLPADEILASTGERTGEKSVDSGRKLISIKASNVRDFTWISSRRFKWVEKESDGIVIRSYFLDEDRVRGIQNLDYASRALKLFSETFGKYPYDSFNVVETYLYGGAMEYPMLVTIGKEYYEDLDGKMLEGAVAHETAHQWWYVAVGNNEYSEPWLDEALASYSEAMYFEKYYNRSEMNRIIDAKIGLSRSERYPGDSLDEFQDSYEYGTVVYLKGAYIIDQFRMLVGDSNFTKVMRQYFETYKFKNANTDSFLEVVKNVCGKNAAEYIKIRIMGNDG